MKYMTLAFVLTVPLSGCGHETIGTAPAAKIEGPPVGELSHEQLMTAYHECTQYGQIDDPKVKYTVPYCAAVQGAQLSSGYTAPGTAKVDPTLNPMH